MKDLKLRNALLLQLINQVQEGIVVAEKEDQDTILIYVNPAFERLTGYSADEILYQDCRFLQGEDSDLQAKQQIREAIAAERPTRTIIKNYRKDGQAFWNELSITPYYDDLDKMTYFIGVQKDVTAQVELQQALQAAEQKVQALEAELTELKSKN